MLEDVILSADPEMLEEAKKYTAPTKSDAAAVYHTNYVKTRHKPYRAYKRRKHTPA